MGDTVKIIIEIPKDHYEFLVDAEEILSSQINDDSNTRKNFMRVIYSTIAKGTPLDDMLNKIRAEIEEYKSTIDNAISEDELKIEGMKEAYTDCLKIIDEYKIESEKV